MSDDRPLSKMLFSEASLINSAIDDGEIEAGELINLLKKCRSKINELHGLIWGHAGEDGLFKRTQLAERELLEAREVIKFYANEDNWDSYGGAQYDAIACTDIEVVQYEGGGKTATAGNRAREFQKKWGLDGA